MQRVGRVLGGHPWLVATGVAVLASGWVYWELLVHLRSITSSDPDLPLFIWSLEHAPKRLFAGENPFYSEVIFARSGGANLTYNATAPGLAIMMYPITAALGAIVSINLLIAIVPVANTLAARRLLHCVTGDRNPVALTFGALIIGFSPLVLMHNDGRLQISFQAVALLLLAELWLASTSELTPRRWAGIGALAGLQLWLGSEMLAIAGVVAVIVGVAFGVARRTLPTVSRRLAERAGLALAAFVVVGLPFLATFLFGSERYPDSYHVPARPLFGLRLANLVSPTEANLAERWLPSVAQPDRLGVFRDEASGYVSVAGLLLVGIVVATWSRRSNIERAAVGLIGAALLLALGSSIRWSGDGTGLPGPWRLVQRLPLVGEIVANRLSWGVFIGLGVIVAGGVRRADRASVAAACLLGLLMLPAPFRHTRPADPSAEQLLRRECRGALVLTVPQEQEQLAMEWQARSDFAFDLDRGFAFRRSSEAKGTRVLLDDIASAGIMTNDDPAAALGELADRGIGCVVASSAAGAVIANVSVVLGRPAVGGDVAVWVVVE